MYEGSSHILFAFIAGAGLWLAAQAVVWRVRARRRRDFEAEPPRTPLIALHYGDNPQRSPDNRPVGGLPILVACALLVLRPGAGSWEYYLWGGFALLGLPRGLERPARFRP